MLVCRIGEIFSFESELKLSLNKSFSQVFCEITYSLQAKSCQRRNNLSPQVMKLVVEGVK